MLLIGTQIVVKNSNIAEKNLNFTKDLKMVLRTLDFFYLNAFVDASFGIYSDMKSATGVVIKIGEATIYV